MTTNSPPGIPRSFRDLSDKDLAETEDASQWARWGLAAGFKWQDLLKARRMLIVSEAGAGKTYECQTCQKRLWDSGEPAFFLELAILADKEVGAMLSPVEQARFDQWRRSQSEMATFFPDSIDELKVTQKSFEQALKSLGRACAGKMDRVRVVITTRPIPVDRQLIELHLAIPPEKGEAVAARALMLNYRRSPEYKFPGAETSAWAFHNLEGLLPICVPVDASSSPYLLAETPPERGTLRQEANMGEVVRFVSKAERERLRLIREARAMYDSVFPSSQSINAQRDKATIAQTVNGPDARYGDNSLP